MKATFLATLGLFFAAAAQAAMPYDGRFGGGGGQGWFIAPVESRGDATAAFQAGRFATALRILRPYAEGGDPDAQYKLGTILGGLGEVGVGREQVARDQAASAGWLKRAAEGGNALAMRDYARAAELGEGTPKDPILAFRYYALAAEKLPEGAARTSSLQDALRLKPQAAAFIAQFPDGDRQAKALAVAVAKTDAMAQATQPEGVSGSTGPNLRR